MSRNSKYSLVTTVQKDQQKKTSNNQPAIESPKVREVIPIKKTASLENAKIDLISANYNQIYNKQNQLSKTVEQLQQKLDNYIMKVEEVECSTRNLQKIENLTSEISENH